MCLHDSARGSWLAGHASQELYNTFVFSFLFFITTTTPNFFRGIGRWLWPNAFSVAPYRPGCKESNLLFRFLFLFIWIFSFWIFFYLNVHLSVPITICSGNHIRVSGASTLFAMTHMHSPPGQVHKVGLRVIFFLYIHLLKHQHNHTMTVTQILTLIRLSVESSVDQMYLHLSSVLLFCLELIWSFLVSFLFNNLCKSIALFETLCMFHVCEWA